MKIYRQLFVTACLVVSLACYSVKAQSQGCPARLDACVSLTAESFEPLLINILVSSLGEQPPVVSVNITAFRVVCETSGIVRDEARQIAIVTRFSCSADLLSACPENSETVGVQYAARCSSSMGGSLVWDFGGADSTTFPASLFSAPVSYCGGCRFTPEPDDLATLCVDQCNTERNCTEGLQRCTGVAADSCCNFYFDDNGDPSDDVCCSECPVGFVPDENFNCGCPNLALTNGDVTYSDGNTRSANSVFTNATFTCNPGYTIVNDTIRTCQPNTGWDGDDNTACVEVMCPVLSDPDNGQVMMNGRTVGQSATYTCNDNYFRNGVETRTCQNSGEWSEDEPTCDIDCPLCQNGGTCDRSSSVTVCVCASGFTGPDCSDIMCPGCLNGGTCDVTTGTCQCPPDFFGVTCTDACEAKIPNCMECSGTGDNPVCIACKADFTLDPDTNECKQNEEAESDKSSCGAGCIAGIIVALVALLIAGITALVIFGIYKYLHNPATKLAKTDTEGLNGVARDNPLYLEPATVVGDGAEAAAPLATPPEAA